MFDQLTSWDNLLLAYRKASKGKRGHANVASFDHRLEDNLLQLQEELQTHAYHPGPYNSFHIHEPKRRLISAAPFRDRVVHHALCNLIEPIFERGFIFDSCEPTVHRRVNGILKVPTVHRRDGRVWQPPLLDIPMTVTSLGTDTGSA